LREGVPRLWGCKNWAREKGRYKTELLPESEEKKKKADPPLTVPVGSDKKKKGNTGGLGWVKEKIGSCASRKGARAGKKGDIAGGEK